MLERDGSWRRSLGIHLAAILAVAGSTLGEGPDPTWRLDAKAPAAASTEQTTNGNDACVRIDIEALDAGRLGEVQLLRTSPADSSVPLEILFPARSAWVRPIAVGRLGKTGIEDRQPVVLEPEWKTFRIELPANPSPLPLPLVIDFSEDKGWVEIGPVTVIVGGKPTRLEMNVLSSAAAPMSPTQPQVAGEKTWSAIVEEPSARPEDVQVRRSMGGLRAGSRGILKFRAQAEVPRPIRVGVSTDDTALTSAGLRQRVELTTRWQEFAFAFPVSRSMASSVVHFDLAEARGAVNVADVTLTEESPPPAPRVWAFDTRGASASCTIVSNSPWHVSVFVQQPGNNDNAVLRVTLPSSTGSTNLVVRTSTPATLPIRILGAGVELTHTWQLPADRWTIVELPREASQKITGPLELVIPVGAEARTIEFADPAAVPENERSAQP
jgi:hypothetical protein